MRLGRLEKVQRRKPRSAGHGGLEDLSKEVVCRNQNVIVEENVVDRDGLMFYRYRFKSEIYLSLSLIPLHVRMKLDITGVKISLKTWQAFTLEERWALCHLPVETEEERGNFSSYIAFLTRRYVGEEPTRVPTATYLPWEDLARVPEPVRMEPILGD